MIREVGVWIDSRKAIIVTIIHPEAGISRIQANLQREVCFPEISFQDGPLQETGSRKSAQELGGYYEDVIAIIREAESIQIFGPGEAKGELENRLERAGLKDHVLAIEAADKMTDRQIAAKVRQRFRH